MSGQHHTEFTGEVLLHPLDCIIFEFHDLAALFTDEMVMMMLASDFKARLVFIEVALSQQLALLEQFEGPVNRCVTDMGVYLFYLEIKLLGTDMAAESKKNPRNIIAWRSGLEPTVAQPRMKQFHPLIRLAPAGMLVHIAIHLTCRRCQPLNARWQN
jgi:hypothetical protein